MSDKIIRVKDSLSVNKIDDYSLSFSDKPSVLRRTRVMGGYDHYYDKKGFSQFGEKLFDEENQIVLGGGMYVLEKLFNVASPLTVAYLNDIMGIATTGTAITEIYPKDNCVCLFGVGTGGCGDTVNSVLDVKYYEREIFNMIPFRVTSDTLTTVEQEKYWFKKTLFTDKTGYYLKKFEVDPQIKVLWKDAEGDEDGTEVEAGVHNTTRTDPIETFVELILKVSKTDVREWFELNGNVDLTRINSIGLFTGIKALLANGTYDYKQVKLFSKLNINNEMLSLTKDLTIVYRIYTS